MSTEYLEVYKDLQALRFKLNSVRELAMNNSVLSRSEYRELKSKLANVQTRIIQIHNTNTKLEKDIEDFIDSFIEQENY